MTSMQIEQSEEFILSVFVFAFVFVWCVLDVVEEVYPLLPGSHVQFYPGIRLTNADYASDFERYPSLSWRAPRQEL